MAVGQDTWSRQQKKKVDQKKWWETGERVGGERRGATHPLDAQLQVAHARLGVGVHVVRGVVERPPAEHEAEQRLHQLELLALLHGLQLEHVLQRRLAEVALRHVLRCVRLRASVLSSVRAPSHPPDSLNSTQLI
jgi:hypothetical protein